MPDGFLQVVSQQIQVDLFRMNKPLRNDAACRSHQHDRPRVGANALINFAVFDAVEDAFFVFGNHIGVVFLSYVGERRVGKRTSHCSHEGFGREGALFGNLDKRAYFSNDVVGRNALASLERGTVEIVINEIPDNGS